METSNIKSILSERQELSFKVALCELKKAPKISVFNNMIMTKTASTDIYFKEENKYTFLGKQYKEYFINGHTIIEGKKFNFKFTERNPEKYNLLKEIASVKISREIEVLKRNLC